MTLMGLLGHRRLALRVLGAALAAAIAVLASPRGPLGNDAALADCSPSVTAQGPPGWIGAAVPTFSSGTQQLSAYAVAPRNPKEVFVTNGTAVARSRDGGCTWATVYTVNPLVPATGLTSVVQIVAADDGRVYLLLSDNEEPKVFASADGGTTWTEADSGVLPSDPVLPIAANHLVASSTPGVLYLDVHNALWVTFTLGQTDELYVTHNGGGSWTLANVPAPGILAGLVGAVSTNTMPVLNQLVVDPGSDQHLWGVGNGRLAESKDGGLNWKVINGADGNPLNVSAVLAARGDDGQTW
jgi:hypothetical protein